MAMAGAAGRMAASRTHKPRASFEKNSKTHKDMFMSKISYEEFKAYDESGSDQLEEPELRRLLTTFSEGTAPSDDEVGFIMARADKGKSGGLTYDEIATGIAQWQAYLPCRPRVHALFALYDVDQSGSLDNAQLNHLLADMNDGNEVSDAEVQMVMDYADVMRNGKLSEPETSLAIAKWYAYGADKKAKAAQKQKKSSACSIL